MILSLLGMMAGSKYILFYYFYFILFCFYLFIMKFIIQEKWDWKLSIKQKCCAKIAVV